jgi:hypothetical protein
MGISKLAAFRRQAILVLLGLVLVVGFSWSSVATSAQGASTSSPSIWAPVLHQGGAYAVLPADIPTFVGAGLTLALTNKIPASPSVDPSHGKVRYIDPRADSYLYQYLAKYHCSRSVAPCPISAGDQQAFLGAFQQELVRQHNNPSVVGYYILDDYLGNIPGLLAQVHNLIAVDNQTLAAPRPTICGFGGTLDFNKPGLAPGTYELDTASLKHFNDLELLNFTPKACDMVTLYIYALNHRAPTSDFSMKLVMPLMLTDLRAHGWDPAQTPLLGTPQTWAGIPPTAAQVRLQTSAFCSFGAQSIIAFTWHNFMATGPNASPELANDAGMRAGLSQGMQDCQHIWSAG